MTLCVCWIAVRLVVWSRSPEQENLQQHEQRFLGKTTSWSQRLPPGLSLCVQVSLSSRRIWVSVPTTAGTSVAHRVVHYRYLKQLIAPFLISQRENTNVVDLLKMNIRCTTLWSVSALSADAAEPECAEQSQRPPRSRLPVPRAHGVGEGENAARQKSNKTSVAVEIVSMAWKHLSEVFGFVDG